MMDGVSEISDAIRADAEAARAEIRAAGIVCPSCGKNAADIYGQHQYEDLDDVGVPSAVLSMSGSLKCTAGTPVAAGTMGYEQFQAVANIALLDEFRRREDRAFEDILGTGPRDRIPGRAAEAPSITCPRCGMTSYNPNDIREGYCGNCHDWTGRPARMSE
jgi:ribosomal protein L37E